MKKIYAALRLGGWLLAGAWAETVVVTSAQAQTAPAARVMAGDGTPQLVRLGAGSSTRTAKPVDVQQLLRRELALGPNDELRPLRSETDALGMAHARFQQYYQGVKVEHGTYSTHSRSGQVQTLTGELKRPAGLRVQPTLNAATARQRALVAVGATRYMWQEAAEERALRQQTGNATATYLPAGELVVVGDFRQPAATRPLVLAWKFDVYAQQPVSRANVYVDAHTGQVVLTDAIIKHANAPGTFATRYSGSRASTTDYTGTTYRLRETSRGQGIETYNCKKGNSYAAAVDFTDLDNDWTDAEYNNANFDNAALDAHYGAQSVHDYWSTRHGRNSYDNAGAKIRSYVHYDDTPGDGVGYNNAFWNGSVMTYGDGAGSFKPLTSLDVCGHEIGHAVCQETANLVYQNESGALNEGFSDIWGACVEYYKDPTKQTWLIGEDIVNVAGKTCLRSMSDPGSSTALNPTPAYYGGLRWTNSVATPTAANDYGGVHTNSGVLNHWFYLLSVGKAGVNEGGNAFSVTGVSIDKAARIAYRAESVYLTSSSDFRAARAATLLAAEDLYGESSAELVAVAHAWFAVGLGEPAPALTSFAQARGPVGSLVTLTGTNFSTAYGVAFNGTVASFAVNSATSITAVVPAAATDGPLTVTTPSGTATSGSSFAVTLGPVITGISPASAANGAPVVISGTYFADATAVTFAPNVSVPAAAFVLDTNVSSNTIALNVPAGAVSGPVTVTAGSTSAGYAFAVVPFTLAARSPVRNALGARYLAPIALTFSAAPDASTAAGTFTSIFSTQRGGRRNERGTFSSAGSVLTYTPAANAAFRPGETVSVTTTAAATSSGGGALQTPETYQFTAAAGRASAALGVPSYPAVGTAPHYVAVGDVNNDGQPDVVATNSGSSTATVLLGNGTGSFGQGGGPTTATLAVGSNPQTVVLADINNDGRLDILVANFNSASVSVWVRNPTGSAAGDFTAAPTLRVETGPIGLSTGDFNNDGWLDVATTNNYSGYAVLNVYTNLKSVTGAFSGYTRLILTGNYAYNVAAADFNSDGWLDLATTNVNGNSVTVVLNNKAGQFTGSGNTYAVGAGPSGLAVGDVNNDSHLDVVTANYAAGTASVLLGSIAGTFTATTAVDLTVAGTNFEPESVSLADLNGDGKLDLVATLLTVNPGQLLTRTGNGDGTFTTPAIAQRSIGTQCFGLAVADVDSNGSLDVVTANSGSSTGANALSVLLNPAVPAVFSITPTSGVRGNTRVIVAGSGFTAASTVSIGGVMLGNATVSPTAWPQTITGTVGATTPIGTAPVVATTGATTSNDDVLFTSNPAMPSISGFAPISGPVGTLVTVTGTDLGGASSVSFNGMAQAAISNNSGTRLQVAVPAGATTGPISVATPDGPATTAGLTEPNFTVTPGITRFGPNPGGLGQAITITGTNLSGVTSLLVNGEDATASITNNTATSLTFQVPVGTPATGITTLVAADGTATSTAFAVVAAPGNALAFDGSAANYVSFGSTPAVDNLGAAAFTLEAWVYHSGSGTAQAIISKGGDYRLYLKDNALHAEVWPTAGAGALRVASGSLLIPANRWTHLAATWSKQGSVLRLYVNGAQDMGTTFDSGLNPSSANLTLGASASAAQPFTGGLDEVRIYSAALTPASIQANMRTTTAAAPASLGFYANFDQGAPGADNSDLRTVYDLANGYPGTLVGFAMTGTASNWVESYAAVVPVATAPTGLSSRGFTATWTPPAVGSVSSYLVDVSEAASFDLPIAGSPFAATDTSLTLSGLSGSSTYYYRVRARKSSLPDQGAFSNRVMVATPLPVELTAFTATAAGPAAVRLAWATASEQHNAGFWVERSADGVAFAPLRFVPGVGSSSSPRAYAYADAAAPAGALAYYRLRQVDMDGSFSYSPVRSVALSAKAGLALYPNPAHAGAATLAGARPGTLVTVFDPLGRPVASAPADAAGTAALVLPAGLPAGVYVVRAGSQALRLTVE